MANQPIPGTESGLQFLNPPFGDTTNTKVFVGGLAWETQSKKLRSHFEQFGEILEAVVITDKHSGRSKGYGFVTFRDPESAKKACADLNPVIDGRKANCNLASLGRPQPYGRLQSTIPYFGIPQMPRGAYIRSPSFYQPVPFNYRSGVAYPPYRYSAYGPEYVYPQGFYNPYMGHQHYLQMYRAPGTVNTNIVPYGQMGQPLPGSHEYTTIQGYLTPGHHVLPYGGPHVNGVTTETIATIQAPHHIGIPALAPGQAQIIFPVHPTQFTQSRGSDQTTG